MSKFSEWLRKERDAKGWNNKSLAIYVGSSGSTVGTWINDGKTPEPKFLIKLSELFEKDWVWVFELAFDLPKISHENQVRTNGETEEVIELFKSLSKENKALAIRLLKTVKN